MSQTSTTETSSRRRGCQITTAQKISDEWDKLREPFNEDKIRLALSEATECFKLQQNSDEPCLETLQDDQYDTEIHLIQDKHRQVRDRLSKMWKAIVRVELEKLTEKVTMSTSSGDAAHIQPKVPKLPQIRRQIPIQIRR